MKDLFKKGSGSTGFGAILALIMVPTLIVCILLGCFAVKDIQAKEELRKQEPQYEVTEEDRQQMQEGMEQLGELSKDFGTGLLWMSLFENNPELAGFLWITQNMHPGNSADTSTTEPTVETTVPEICENCNEPCNTPYCAQCGEKQ